MKNRDISYPEEGTPQGGVVSPLLSNIYLHEALDNWYAKEIHPHLKGRSFMIRFADDAILG
ncbi:MAG: RNA-directed polymerase, partial [Acidobacteriota bacterium]|nr:RNA-directed polymerase [Acidobacteriota bacterium]